MNTEGVKRKLTAILSADVKGYSRLMSQDEEATVKALKEHRETISGLILDHRGRVVDAPGDNILAEFGSVVDAVKCAVQIQQALKTKNAWLPEDRRMNFRIGVNLGDVIEEEDRIYGDGVNIAARLEGLAEGGGICISGTSFDQVKNKLSVGYQYVGKQTVKNIPDPVRAYNVLTEPGAVGKVIGEEEPKPAKWGWKTVAAGVLVLVVLIGGLVWNFYLRTPRIEPASVERMALPLPEEPSIAVLPFTNMSGDTEQEYFSDGITEEIITALAKIPQLLVIARNSTFTYKGKPVKVQKVAEDLGVRYVLEGGVRKAGDKIRITAQLIDAISGHHLWAERYDGKMGDVFGLQDKITEKIVAALAVELTSDEQENIARRGTDNAAAYDAYLQGREYYLRHTRDDMVKAVTYFKRAIELDPNFPQAHAGLSLTYNTSRARRWDQDLGWTDTRSLAEKHLQLAMKNPTPKVHRAAAWHYIWKRQHEKAIAEAERSLTLEPNNSKSHSTMGAALIYAGRSKEAIDFWKKAMRLDPYYPARYLWDLGLAQFCVGQLEEAATSFERARKRNPGLGAWPHAATYAHLGREQEAKGVLAEYMKKRGISKPPTVKEVLKYYPFKDPKDRDRFAEGLRKAGVPME